jgi:predicted O-methyltransferase YrrM
MAETNPYLGRPYPVGKLGYELTLQGQEAVKSVGACAMLEFGEQELLYDLPRIFKGGSIANLGHARGGSALLMAKGLQDNSLSGFIRSVDTFKYKGGLRFSEAYERVVEHELESYIALYKGTTDYWGEKFSKRRLEFDFIFIDADHSYKGVQSDFRVWSPMLKEGGLVAFHDTNQEFSRQVLDEELIGNPLWNEYEDLHINRIRIFEKRA